jgi:hypothetical protein
MEEEDEEGEEEEEEEEEEEDQEEEPNFLWQGFRRRLYSNLCAIRRAGLTGKSARNNHELKTQNRSNSERRPKNPEGWPKEKIPLARLAWNKNNIPGNSLVSSF